MGLSENAAALQRILGEEGDQFDPERVRRLVNAIADEAHWLALAADSYDGPGLGGLIAGLVTLASPQSASTFTVSINGHRASSDVAAAYAVMRYGLDALERPIAATGCAADSYYHQVALMLAGHRGADTTCYAALNLLHADTHGGAQPPSDEAIACELRDAHNPIRAQHEPPDPRRGARAGVRENAETLSQLLCSAGQLDDAELRMRVSQLAREAAILARVTTTNYGAAMTDVIRALVGPTQSHEVREESVAIDGQRMKSDVAPTYAVMRYGPEVIDVPTTATLYASDIYWHAVGRLLAGARPAQAPHAEALSLLHGDRARGAAPWSVHPIACQLRDAYPNHSTPPPAQ